MVVPRELCRQDEVVRLHVHLAAGDSSVGATALDHEADREDGMAMAERALARHEDLQRADCERQSMSRSVRRTDGVGRVGRVRAGVDEDERATLGFDRVGDRRRVQDERAHLPEGPAERDALGVRVARGLLERAARSARRAADATDPFQSGLTWRVSTWAWKASRPIDCTSGLVLRKRRPIEDDAVRDSVSVGGAIAGSQVNRR